MRIEAHPEKKDLQRDILKKEQEYYLLCHTGQRSYYLTNYLTEQGYNVINVYGGITVMKDYYIHY